MSKKVKRVFNVCWECERFDCYFGTKKHRHPTYSCEMDKLSVDVETYEKRKVPLKCEMMAKHEAKQKMQFSWKDDIPWLLIFLGVMGLILLGGVLVSIMKNN